MVFSYTTLFESLFGHVIQISYTMKPRTAFKYSMIFGCYVNMIGSQFNLMRANEIDITAEYHEAPECNPGFPIVYTGKL